MIEPLALEHISEPPALGELGPLGSLCLSTCSSIGYRGSVHL
jgi:hypothetical protein